jgi:hypothetical protein
MRDYFDNDYCEGNENRDTVERCKNRPKKDLEAALLYDQQFINKILNKPRLTEADKCNIARTTKLISFQLLEYSKATASFEDFIEEVMGEEWFRNVSSKWLQRRLNDFAAQTGCSEFLNFRGVYIYKPGEDDGEISI